MLLFFKIKDGTKFLENDLEGEKLDLSEEFILKLFKAYSSRIN